MYRENVTRGKFLDCKKSILGGRSFTCKYFSIKTINAHLLLNHFVCGHKRVVIKMAYILISIFNALQVNEF